VSRLAVFGILAGCALLEAGGDALVRKGMHAGSSINRIALYLCAALVLFAYGWLVNRPPWSFGSLLGIYVVLFFVVAQLLGIFVFGERLTPPLALGGALMIAGGLVITFWRQA
jgi:drug/metabolite transporter (DMT)-like permease